MKSILTAAAVLMISCDAFADTWFCYAPAAGAKVLYVSDVFAKDGSATDVGFYYGERLDAGRKPHGAVTCVAGSTANLDDAMKTAESTYTKVGYSVQFAN